MTITMAITISIKPANPLILNFKFKKLEPITPAFSLCSLPFAKNQ